MSVLKQQRRMVRQQRNNDALAIAMQHRTYVSAHIKEGSPQPELYEFLPHPREWILFNSNRKLKISKACAVDILSSLPYLNYDIECALEPYMNEIEIALGT